VKNEKIDFIGFNPGSVQDDTDPGIANENMVASEQQGQARGKHKGQFDIPAYRPTSKQDGKSDDQRQVDEINPIGGVGEIAPHGVGTVKKAFEGAEPSQHESPGYRGVKQKIDDSKSEAGVVMERIYPIQQPSDGK